MKSKRRVLPDKKYPRTQRRFTWAWLSDQPNFTLIHAALDTARRQFRAHAHHAGTGRGPARYASAKLARRYAKIMAHLQGMLKA